MIKVFGIILLLVFLSANAAFEGRLPATPGGTDYQAYYDDQLDITWLSDANAAVGTQWDYDPDEKPNDEKMPRSTAFQTGWLDRPLKRTFRGGVSRR